MILSHGLTQVQDLTPVARMIAGATNLRDNSILQPASVAPVDAIGAVSPN